MANRPKHTDAIVLALAQGLGVAAAARQAQVHERTVRRRLADPDFRARVDQARAGMVSEAVGRLSLAGGAAATVLAQLVGSAGSEAVRLGACRAVLDHMFRGVEADTLARQLAELRAEIAEVKREHSRNAERGATDAVGAEGGEALDGAVAGAVAGPPGPCDVRGRDGA